MANKPDVKSITHMAQLPATPDGQPYYFKPAATIDQARGVCARVGVKQGWWLKNRVYYYFEAAPNSQVKLQEGQPA